jgi:hypothetical protein
MNAGKKPLTAEVAKDAKRVRDERGRDGLRLGHRAFT